MGRASARLLLLAFSCAFSWLLPLNLITFPSLFHEPRLSLEQDTGVRRGHTARTISWAGWPCLGWA